MPSTPAHVPTVRVAGDQTRITVGIAMAAWAMCWLGGNILGGTAVALAGHEGDDLPIWVTVLSALALWTPTVAILVEVSRRYGVGSLPRDFGLAFRPLDLLGVPIGVLSQLVLLRLVYWPLESVWPDTFSSPKIEESARSLYERADGVWLVALVLMVVVGAPLVEELLYRGLLQGAFERRIHEPVAVLVVAVWFALIHFRPVEYPGLFVIGLVLGVCALVTRRLGMSIVAHCAFNATGLAWVATR